MNAVRKILCATDLSAASVPAWEEAQFLAGLFEAEALLLHVVPPLPVPLEGHLSPDLYQQVVTQGRLEAREGLEKLAESAVNPPAVHARLEEGVPVRRIVAVAREEAVDLLVLGTHGRTGLGRVLLGSVADAVVRLAPCPVVTVRARPGGGEPPGRGITRICYATDFSPVARAAWPWVLALAEMTGAEVDLVHVTFGAVPERHLAPATIEAMVRTLREQGEAEAERFLTGSPLPRERIHVLVGGGVVSDQVIHWARARSADLIVLGTHGWSGLVRWALGSVAHQVIQMALCPVLTVGPGERRAERHDDA